MTYKQFITHKCLTRLMWLTAILGMVSCATVHSVRVGSFDRDLDQCWALLEKGDIKSRRSLSVGGHLHTRGLPNKYEFKEWEAFEEYWRDERRMYLALVFLTQ